MYQKKVQVFISVGIFLFVFLFFGIKFIYDYQKNKDSKKTEDIEIEFVDSTLLESEVLEEVKEDENIISWMVDVKGAVNVPGAYQVSPEMRVVDVISLAGGLLNNANTNYINLSKKVSDQMVIYVYSNDEVEKLEETVLLKETVQNDCNNKNPDNNACLQEKEDEVRSCIDLNMATVTELLELPGVGEKKALAIIEKREELGQFSDINQLLEVSGIGESLFESIKSYLCS